MSNPNPLASALPQQVDDELTDELDDLAQRNPLALSPEFHVDYNARAAEIRALCRRAGMEKLCDGFIREHLSPAEAQDRLFEGLAAQHKADQSRGEL